jgi:putative membrane protein
MAYVKALHIIFVVTWFAALFYMPRLLVYHIEASRKPDPDRGILQNQFSIMEKRLWFGIAWPSMILTVIFGSWLFFDRFSFLLTQAWFLLKLFFVVALVFYHIYTHVLFLDFRRGIIRWSSMKMRLWNEVPTVFLFLIVFLVVVQRNDTWVWATLSAIVLVLGILGGIFVYRKYRLSAEASQLEAEQQHKQQPVPPAAPANENEQAPPPPPPVA